MTHRTMADIVATPTPRLRKALLITGALLLTTALAYVLRASLLTALADVLIVENELRPADLIFVLNGEINTRPSHAAALYRQGLAPQIVIPRQENCYAAEMGLMPNGSDVAADMLTDMGIPAEHITVLLKEGGVTSTYDEAVMLRQYLEEHPARRVILVTSAFHTRRARWVFLKQLADLPVELEVSAAPHGTFDRTNWWHKEQGLVMLTNEYIKLVYYLVTYG